VSGPRWTKPPDEDDADYFNTPPGCGCCHTCGAALICLDDDPSNDAVGEWCEECRQYRRYISHGYLDEGEVSSCPMPLFPGL